MAGSVVVAQPLPPGAPTPSQAVAAARETVPDDPSGFSFGSYGRVGVASDLRGRTAIDTNLVAFGPRLLLAPYAELQFNYERRNGDVRWRVITTIGVNNDLFHYTGDFTATFAIRNLYVEERGALHEHLSLWVGSRMYRGDDVYLLNFWPMDSLNMIGGGARFDAGSHVAVQAAVGMNRLDNPYQLQTLSVAARDGFGPTTAYLLDRPRIFGAAKATWYSAGRTSREGLKLSLYGEFHSIAAGVRQTNDAGTRIELPSDDGWVVGAQAGLYRGPSFLNVFVRYGQGLGAYGDLAVPITLASARTSARAQDIRVALSGNWESGAFALMVGAYFRFFRDADPGVFSRNALVEGAVAVRPIVWFGQRAGVSAEASYQHVVYDAIDPATGSGALAGTVWRFSVMPFVSPMGRGSDTRPHLQLIYAASIRDEGARRLYAPDDPAGFNTVEHYLGLGAEWWFNSSYL